MPPTLKLVGLGLPSAPLPRLLPHAGSYSSIIMPIFHTVFARVYPTTPYLSELCKGLYHHNGV